MMVNILINGKKSTQYKFKMDYYWMMGDNRHRSEDSRFWGLFPRTTLLENQFHLVQH